MNVNSKIEIAILMGFRLEKLSIVSFRYTVFMTFILLNIHFNKFLDGLKLVNALNIRPWDPFSDSTKVKT